MMANLLSLAFVVVVFWALRSIFSEKDDAKTSDIDVYCDDYDYDYDYDEEDNEEDDIQI